MGEDATEAAAGEGNARVSLSHYLLQGRKCFKELQNLHQLLWGKSEQLHSTIVKVKSLTVPHYDSSSLSFDAEPTSSTKEVWKWIELQPSGSVRTVSLPCDLPAILVRPTFEELYEVLKRRVDRGPSSAFIHFGGVLLLGQPGIGKSVFLSYALVMRLLAGQVTVFQNFCGAIYIFRPKGIDLVNDSQELADKHSDITSDKSIWVLADSPPNSMILHETNWFPIYASSPREENYKHWKKHVNPDVLYMNAWSWSEVVANRELCLPGGTMRSLAYFHMIFSLYGPVARTIFHLILPPLQNDEEDQIRFKEDFARYEELIEKKAAQTVLANDYLFIEDTPSAISHTGSHTLTLILPTSPIKSAQPKQIQRSYQLTPITNHVLSRIAQAAVRRDAEKGKAFFNQVMNRYPQVFGSLQGVVFETLVHRLLSLGPTLWLYDLPLTHGRTPPPVEILISLELSESREFANLENLGSQLRLRKNSPNIHPKSLNTYLRPTIGNLGAIDALALIDPSHIGWRKKPASYDPSLPTLVLFQCTVSRDHPISLVALNKVLDAVPANGTKNPVIFLWVLPGERIRKIINSEVRAGGSKHIFRPQLYKDAAGCKAVEVRQMITTFSTKRLWGFAEWVIGNDRIALESKGIEKKEIQQLAEFTKDAQYTGEAVVKGQRVVSNNVWHVLSSTTPGGANT